MTKTLSGLCLLACCLMCSAQTQPTNNYEADLEAKSGLEPAHVEDGDFILLLPKELTPEDPAAGMHSYRGIPALNLPKTAAEVGKDPCSHLLLLVGTGGDEAGELAARGPNKKKLVATPPSRGIAIVEIDDRCVSKLKADDVLAQLAHEGQEVDGLAPTAHMISYDVDGHSVWLAMSSGYSKDEHGKRTAKAGTTLVGNISFSANGHFFVLGLVANDAELFNRMLSMRIQFKGPSAWLVPFKLANERDAVDAVPK